MLWNCLKIYCPHLAVLTFCDYWLWKIYWLCQADEVQKLLPGNNKALIFRVLNTNRSFLLHTFNIHKKIKTSCKAKLKKERRKIPLIKCKSEWGFTPSWLKPMVKSIVTSKQGWSCPGTLQDQFRASWDWWQVENSSERSSWQQSSHVWAPGSWGGCGHRAPAIRACETFQELRPHKRPTRPHEVVRMAPWGSLNCQWRIMLFVRGPVRCSSAGI